MMEVSKETETTTSTTCEEKRDEVEHKDAWKPIENVVEDKIEETVPVDVEVRRKGPVLYITSGEKGPKYQHHKFAVYFSVRREKGHRTLCCLLQCLLLLLW